MIIDLLLDVFQFFKSLVKSYSIDNLLFFCLIASALHLKKKELLVKRKNKKEIGFLHVSLLIYTIPLYLIRDTSTVRVWYFVRQRVNKFHQDMKINLGDNVYLLVQVDEHDRSNLIDYYA